MKKNLDKFYQDPEWVIVEGILLDCLQELSFVPTDDTPPADFKAQMLANKKLLLGVKNFLSQAKVLTKEIEPKKSNNPFE